MAQRAALNFGRTSWSAALVAALVLALAGTARAAERVSCDDITYYKLVQEWAPTYCIKSRFEPCAASGKEAWSVHGLWPDYGHKKGDPAYCSGRKFTLTPLQDMVPELEKSWSNLVLEERDSESQDRTWLWAHEWHKHGICAQRCDPKIQSERDYFSLAIALYNKFDVAQALSQASLTPQPAEGAVEIETDKVRAAIVKAFGKQPTLQCYNDRDSGRSYLADIAICVDKENRELIDCPGGAAIDYTRGFESCPARVHYPTMPR